MQLKRLTLILASTFWIMLIGHGQRYITRYSPMLWVMSPLPEASALTTGYTITPDDKIQIKVTFNRPVDPATVIVNNSVFLVFTKDAKAAAHVKWNSEQKEFTFVTVKTRKELLNTGYQEFTLKLYGSPRVALYIAPNKPIAIKSVSGLNLDGNGDGYVGGLYMVNFAINY